MSTPGYVYVILGAGRQGTAAAYDLGRFGDARAVTLADRSPALARQAADRVNALLAREGREAVAAAWPHAVEAADEAAARALLRGGDVALSAVPYFFNVALTEWAIAEGTHLVDMGGHTGVVREQLARDAAARAAGTVVLPDCGMGPGLVNVLAVRAMERLDVARAVTIYDAGMPQEPRPPWNYQCGFHLNGLTNEYDGTVPLLRGGRIVELEALSDPRPIELEPFGTMEAFIAAGGSTAPWTFQGRLERFETRVLRLPGHADRFRAYRELGLFDLEPVRTPVTLPDGTRVEAAVVPRDLYHLLLARHIVAPELRDVCIMHAVAEGTRGGKPATSVEDIVDRYDPETGFTGMERLTGFHCAMMMAFVARGVCAPGARALEARLLDGEPSAEAVLDAVRRRGIEVRET